MQFFIDKGLSFADAIEFARMAETANPRSVNAERQQRYRDNKRNVTRNVTPPIDNTHTPQDNPIEAKASIAPRGRKPKTSHRLPNDWKPEPLTGETAIMVDAWVSGRIERELSKFRDYWKAASGRSAVKDDWQAALRFWLRNSDERGTSNGNYRHTRNQQNSMGVTERAARQAMHEISGGTGRFDEGSKCNEALPSGEGYRTLDAMPDIVRAIGHAGR